MPRANAGAWILPATLVASLCRPDRAAGDADSDAAKPEGTEQALSKGIAYLKGQQRPDGSWGAIGGGESYGGKGKGYTFPVGPTALALYALLECGVSKEDAGV